MKKITLLFLMFVTSLSYAQYCPSTPSSLDGAGISNVQVGTTSFTGSALTYLDFTGAPVDIQAGSTINTQITFQAGYTYDTNIWIDFGDDDSFDEAGDLVWSGESGSAVPTTLNASFLLNVASALGVHRMRIGTADSGQANPDSCYSGSYGVSVDLDVNITAAPSCLSPSALTSSAIGLDTASFSWVMGDTETAWEYANLLATDPAPTTGTPIGSMSYTAMNLTTSTDYVFYVRADCGGTFSSFTSVAYSTASPGEVCETAIDASMLPYNTSDDTANYGDDYAGSPGASGCGSTANYLNGDDVVYSLTATADGTVNIALSGLGDTYAGIFVYTACADIGIACQAGAVNTFNTNDIDFDLPVTNGDTYYIVISTYASPQSTTYTLDIVEILCPDPNTLAAANITNTSADLSWTDMGTTANWNLEILTSGTLATGVATDTSATNAFAASGLTPATSYDYYVQASCGDSQSLWIGPFTFSTACNVFTAPYTQDFENAGASPTCWSNDLGAEDWVFANTAAGNHIGANGTITGSTASGGYFAWVDSSAEELDAVLLSPLVDVSNLTTPILSFFEISDNEGGGANSQLEVEVWDGAAWNSMETYNTNTTGGWELKIINLSTLTVTGAVQARFTFSEPEVPADFYDDIAIDDVTFGELPSCFAPTAVNNTVLTDMAADFTWAPGGTEEIWEYANVASPSTDPASGVSTTTGAAAFTGLTSETAYDFYVRSDCEDSTSDWLKVSYTTPPSPPANDDLANAAAIACGDVVIGDNTSASLDEDDAPDPTLSGADTDSPNVWYSWTGTGETVTLSTIAPGFTLDTDIVVFTGTSGALTAIAGGYDEGGSPDYQSLVTFASVSGTNYLFSVDGYNANNIGTFELTMTCVPTPPANDDCADAEDLTLGMLATQVDTTNATDSGIAAGSCGTTGGDQDVWFSFDGPATGQVLVNTDADTVVIYDACGGNEVACGADGLEVVATTGTTYYARVYNTGIAKVAGPFSFLISETTLSTTDFDSSIGFSYYPNPVNNTLTLNAQKEISNVAVFNMLGQEVIRTAPNAMSNDVDMSNLQSGAYFVQVTIGQAVETVRVLKN
ncbi:MAG: T9SS type A sorting domain-containing protein [Lacinutrix sp.]|uniref:T9SS type A sorting domain-containing protein n=1 Tax=Lacinutrix sp. TaxID=1937692 RepID=UPI0030AC9E1E